MAGAPVLVVGCGPVGMTTALCLARLGVPSVVLEAAEGLSGEGSKSICVQRDVLEIFERLGLGRAMAERGVSWTLGRTYFRGTELFQIRFPEVGPAAFPPFINLGQAEVEAFLLGAVAGQRAGRGALGPPGRRRRQDQHGVTLTVTGPRGTEQVAGPYAVACDGPRSTVRKVLGVEFPGHSFPDRFLIADVRAKLPFPSERRFFFDPPFNPGRQVLVHPQPDDVWRIDWQIPGEVDLDDEQASGRLERRIRAIVGEVAYELVWASVYRFHQRAAERFAAGRVFLAGDAAHLMSPFGARGLNSGVADAENIAWKLAMVLAGRAPAALLATYDSERRAAALHNLAVTDATMRFMVPPNRLLRLYRNAILRGSLRSAALRKRVNSGRLSEPYTYTASPVVGPGPRSSGGKRRPPGPPRGPWPAPWRGRSRRSLPAGSAAGRRRPPAHPAAGAAGRRLPRSVPARRPRRRTRAGRARRGGAAAAACQAPPRRPRRPGRAAAAAHRDRSDRHGGRAGRELRRGARDPLGHPPRRPPGRPRARCHLVRRAGRAGRRLAPAGRPPGGPRGRLSRRPLQRCRFSNTPAAPMPPPTHMVTMP